MAKYKEYSQNQIMLLPPSLEEKISQKHIARVINNVIDKLDIAAIDNEYSELGRKAYHPRLLLKILVYGYCLGIRSSRKIQRLTQEDIVFMWLSGQQIPDFRTISDFRKEKIFSIKELFIQILSTCKELGMINCGKVCIDGTKIEANSSRNKVTYRKNLIRYKNKYEEEVNKIFEEAEKIDAEEDALYGEHDGYSLDREITPEEIQSALDKVTKKKNKLKNKLSKIQIKKENIESKLTRMGNSRNSFGNTDKDATSMFMKEGYIGPGYNVQFATENQVIVGYGVYNNRTDYELLPVMVEEVERNTKKTPRYIVADKGYCKQQNYEYLEKRKITGVIPPQSYEQDCSAIKHGVYKYTGTEYEKIKLRMMDFLKTDKGRKLYNIRKNDIEPVIGDIKHNMSFRKFMLRLKPKADIEIGLVSLAHNIKKMMLWQQKQNLDLQTI